VPPPEKALRYLELHGEESAGFGGKPRRLTGTASRVRAQIEEVAEAYGAEEAIVVTITHDHRARRRSYELLAGEFGLDAEASAPAHTVPASSPSATS
jgi:alkanesulfonate monooxygenase SsuD/methylene tetrahydromethanopterin reductase-like flavin-dependent oxidoreductase (luciferase family)